MVMDMLMASSFTIPHHSPIVHRLSPPPPNLRLFSNHQLILLAPLKDTPTSNTTFLKIFAWIFEYRSIVWNQLKSESIVTFLHAETFRSNHRWGWAGSAWRFCEISWKIQENFMRFHKRLRHCALQALAWFFPHYDISVRYVATTLLNIHIYSYISVEKCIYIPSDICISKLWLIYIPRYVSEICRQTPAVCPSPPPPLCKKRIVIY